MAGRPRTAASFLRLAGTSAAGLLLARPHDAIGQMIGGSGPFNDYRALVCLFLFGGNDSFNMLVPRSAAEYNAYAASRQNLSVTQADLLAIESQNPDGAQYGVHPSMQGLQALFEQGSAAFVANVGPLIVPTTKAQYTAKSRAAAAATVLAQRPAGSVAFAARANAERYGLGGAHGRPDSPERREPAARDERLAGRQHAVPVRRRHGRVHDGRVGAARVPRVHGARAASSAARSSESSTRATTRSTRAASPRCNGARCEAADRVTTAIAPTRKSPPFTTVSRRRRSASSSKPSRALICGARSARDAAPGVLRVDGRLRQPRRSVDQSAESARQRQRLPRGVLRRDGRARRREFGHDVHAVGFRPHADVERRRHRPRVGRRADRRRPVRAWATHLRPLSESWR